jgi:hypothetical protein
VIGIPLYAIPSQQLTVNLGGQSCLISVYQKSSGLFLDLTANGVVIATGLLCLDRSLLVRAAYLGFTGDLSFVDSLGAQDPTYDALGTRYQLIYLAPAEVEAYS